MSLELVKKGPDSIVRIEESSPETSFHENLIEIEDLEKIYRPQVEDPDAQEVRALDGVTLTIKKGDYVSIVGPSGSGKSTLMQILGLLDRPSGGIYKLNGINVNDLSDDELADLRGREIGFIFQFFNLLPRTTCVDNVALPMLYSGYEKAEERAKSLLERFDMQHRFWHRSHQLSGGQQQRVAIARALANKPRILFADEPTGNINSEQSEEVMQLLEELNKDGVTIVLVTHEPEVAERARRSITIKDGVIASDVRRRPLLEPKRREMPRSNSWSESLETPKKKKSGLGKLLVENLKMALVALSLNKLRTSLATLGVVIGIASVVAMISIGQGAQKAINEQLSALGTNLLSVRAISARNKGGESYYRKFTLDDLQAVRNLVRPNSLFAGADGKVYGNVRVQREAENKTVQVVGALPVTEKLENNTPIIGRFYTEQENRARARVAVIGQTVVRDLFPEGKNPIGALIKVNRMEFKVIGVLPSKGATAFRDRDNVLLLPLYTAMYRVLGKRKLHNLTIEMRDPTQMETGVSQLTNILRERRKIPAYRDNDFEIRNMNEIQNIYNRTTGIISSMLASIALVSLIVGGIGIMNVMLVAVKERTREVGLRKALGANRKNILAQFLIESILIGLLGGVLGIIGGYTLSGIASTVFAWPAVVPLWAIGLAFGFSLSVGVVFGLWPAKQASDLSPIEALRYE